MKQLASPLTTCNSVYNGEDFLLLCAPCNVCLKQRTWKKVVPKVGSFAVLQDPRPEPHPDRAFTRDAKRVIIKVGTGVVTRSRDGRLSLGRLGALVEQVSAISPTA
eukprot:scaffold1894_cov368-Prasinococcus_capsulatus_cf.AAC.1